MEGAAVEGTAVCVSREEVLHALIEIKTGRSPCSSEVSLELIVANIGVRFHVMAEICQSILLSVLVYADDLVLMSETIVKIRNMFLKSKEAFESK